jgi:hypothetical protein
VLWKRRTPGSEPAVDSPVQRGVFSTPGEFAACIDKLLTAWLRFAPDVSC